MNERIKELWGQATFDESRMIGGIYHPYIPLQYGGEPIRYSITEDQIEKFAELIVRECARYINERTLDWDADLRWIFNDGSGDMAVDVDDLLKNILELKNDSIFTNCNSGEEPW